MALNFTIFKFKTLPLTHTHAFDWKVGVNENCGFSCAISLLSHTKRDFPAIIPCCAAEHGTGLEYSLFRYIFSAEG
jgi:hypothetical protein